MKKFEGIFFATDLDGTLLRNDKSISEENLDAIKYFMAEGGTFTFVTGRATVGATGVYDVIKPNAPCGCFNGGGIYDFAKQQILWGVKMPENVLELVKYVDDNFPEIGIEVHTQKNIYFCKPSVATEEHKAHESLPDLYCSYYDIQEDFVKILFGGESCDLPELIDGLKLHSMSKNFDFIRSDAKYYEILPKGVNKGNLVEKIGEIMGIGMDKTIAVGDNDNDAEMLKRVGYGFAVSNASPMAKQSADYITVSNEENAIAKIITELDCGKLAI